MKKNGNCKIAVIGIGCYYPGAKSPLQLWENILGRRQQFRSMPDSRLPNHEYYDPDPAVIDKTYLNKAAVLDGYSFDWLGKRIPKNTFESTDIVHWLALDTAIQAISDARYAKDTIPHDMTGVILGNTLTGEFTRSNTMLLRWPYVRKALRASLKQKGLLGHMDMLEYTMEKYYKSVFAPVTEDTLAGGLANTIAGRVCNYLDLHGGGYIVDGACSSSLLAICTAANYLELGQMDMVIAGGVDVSLDTFELVGFAKTGALTHDEMRVYDKQGKGFIPGEGCGMVVLKRLEDAIRDKDQVYSIINGWGIASDGKGGITAPNAVGQSRALLRAYEKAAFDTSKLDFIEGHGTGTTVGDKTELEGITIALNHEKPLEMRSCGVTSFKSIVGHTKAAAGVGAFIKTVIALNRRVLPPTAGLKDFNPIFEEFAKTVYPILHGAIKEPGSILHAGVSAMGFGGINSHVLMQSGDAPSASLQPSVEERKLLVSNQTSEVFLFAAKTKKELIELIEKTIDNGAGMSYGELADFACHVNNAVDMSAPLRAAVVATMPFDLERKLKVLRLELDAPPRQGFTSLEADSIVFGEKNDNLRVGALYPGQGAQKLNMTYKLVERFEWARQMIADARNILEKEKAGDIIDSVFRLTDRMRDKQQENEWRDALKQTNVAQPAIILASLLWQTYLKRLGITITTATGHSLGELMSFYAGGFYDEDTLLRFAAFRGKSMAECGSGSMASLVCSKEVAETFIKRVSGYVTVANINAPEQTVLSGDKDAIKQIIKLAESEHIGAVELPVSAAFHSSLIADTAKAIENCALLKNVTSRETNVKLISSVSAKPVTNSTELAKYFSDQAISQVNFIDAIKTIKEECDVFVEIGPGKVLGGLAASISKDVKSFSVEAQAKDDVSFNTMLANLFVRGVNLVVKEIYADRLIRDFVPAYQKTFIVNPLERPFPEDFDNSDMPVNQGTDLNSVMQHLSFDTASVADYMAIRGSFIKDVITADMRHYKGHGPVTSAHQITKEIKFTNESASVNNVASAPVNFETAVFNLVNENTGFPQAQLNRNLKLLDDLNLDSIKAGAFLAALIKKYSLQGKFEATAHANATLGEIIDLLDKFVEIPSGAVLPATAEESVDSAVMKLIAEKTGFPGESIKPEFRLLDDLNLDSIKAGALLAELTRKYNLQGKIEAVAFSNASISEIIAKIKSLYTTQPAKTAPIVIEEMDEHYWVRSFTAEVVKEELPPNPSAKGFTVNDLVVVHTVANKIAADAMAKSLGGKFKNIMVVDNQTLLTSEKACDRLLVMVPPCTGDMVTIKETIALFAAVAQYQWGKIGEIGFIQEGDGEFSRGASGRKITNVLSGAAFAASLHLERPSVKIRVIELAQGTSADFIAERLSLEFATRESYVAAGYNQKKERSTIAYKLAVHDAQPRKNGTPGKEDVILVTGGAKGITAECAIALATKYQCSMALVGSSAVNREVHDTLDRYAALNLTASYYTCNITDAAAVEALVAQVKKDFGSVTGVIHGAGMNVPRRAEQVSYADASKEIAPKLMGAYHIIEALKSDNLKYFIALTSIIGVTGMKGNGWYAFSNETLDMLLRNLHASKNTQTLSVAYSVWSQVGMGERMGSTKVLAGMGIDAITPDRGVEEFLCWIENSASDQQVVVASRLGGLDTWIRKDKSVPPANRYLEEIRYFEPGVEMIARASLNRKHDVYTDDHNYNGSLLFPTVFGLESMAQAVAAVAGVTAFKSLRIENISLQRPIVVPEQGDTHIQIRASVMHNAAGSSNTLRIKAGVSTEQSNFTTDHFSAEFIVNHHLAPEVLKQDISGGPLPLDPKSDLYSWLLFQGKTFQNIGKVYRMNKDQAVFSTVAIDGDTSSICFSEAKRKPFIIGSPLLRDVLLQSAQLVLTKSIYLPIKIGAWDFYKPGNQPQAGYVTCDLVENADPVGIFDVTYTDAAFGVTEKIHGYEVKALKPTPHYPAPSEIADITANIKQQVLNSLEKFADIMESKIEVVVYKNEAQFHRLDLQKRHSIENDVFIKKYLPGNAYGLTSKNQLQWDGKGKPFITDSTLSVSVSHSQSLLLMTTGNDAQGCDIEFADHRSAETWKDMLGKHYSLLGNIDVTGKNADLSATRIWSAVEAASKATGMRPESISITKNNDAGILFTIDNSIHVLTFSIDIWPTRKAIVALTVKLKVAAPVAIVPETKDERDSLFDQASGKFIHHFYTSFKDCKGFFGKTYFTDFPLWMGHLRELALNPVGKNLVADLRSGKYGMVTNASSLHIFNEAESLNKIIGKIWVTPLSDFDNSFIDLNFEWFKETPSGLIKLAASNLSTTWVTIEGHGIVKQSPLPAYFRDFLEKHKRNSIDTHTNGVHNDFISVTQLGKVLYESLPKPRPAILLNKKSFQTGIYDGNSVGNLYYSNYYDWQARNAEAFLFNIVPQVFKENGRAGEFICLESVVNHLQEAMPFEEIEVDMYLENIYENGLKLFFEYYSIGKSGKRKLSFGYNILAWAKRTDEKAIPLAQKLPLEILNHLKGMQNPTTVM